MPKLKSLGGDLQTALFDLIEYYRSLAADGISFSDAWSLIQRSLASFLKVLEVTSNLSRAEKNALAVEAAGELYDALAPLIDIPGVPEFVEVRFIDPALRKLVTQLAEGAVTALVTIFDRIGWTDQPSSDPQIPVIPGLQKITAFQPY